MADLAWADLEWRKSSASGGGNCVEVAVAGDVVFVRNSKDQSAPPQAFLGSEWDAFLVGVRNGEFDRR